MKAHAAASHLKHNYSSKPEEVMGLGSIRDELVRGGGAEGPGINVSIITRF